MSLDDEPPKKRFKYQSYAAELKNVHLPSNLSQNRNLDDLEDDQSQFHEALEHWQQLNLSPAFLKFARQASPLSASLPLLLHHRKDVLKLWIEAKDASDDEGLKAILDLVQKLVQDLRTTVIEEYPTILDNLLELLPRQLSAATLTTLLTTFSIIFKHLLVATAPEEQLVDTWDRLCKKLPKCLPEVCRAMAEVWGGAVRRMKIPLRKVAVELLLKRVREFEDFTAWVFVYACESVSQSLHTATDSLISPLLDYYMAYEGEDEDKLFTLIRRVLTALIHHVKNAEHFTVLSTLIFDKFIATKTRRAIDVLTVATSVRNGSRFTQAQLVQVMECLMGVERHESSLKLACAVLVGGEMSLWTSAGRRYLESCWSDTKFAIQLHGALKDLGWGGWKLIGLPAVIKHTQELLEKEPIFGAKLIASLEVKDKDVNIVWRKRVGDWASTRLATSDISIDADVLKLTRHCDSSICNVLVRRAENAFATGDRSSLSTLLLSLSDRPYDEWKTSVDLTSWLKIALGHDEVDAGVLHGLQLLSQKGTTKSLPFDEVYPKLQDLLSSHSRASRLASLRLLSSALVDTPAPTKEVVQRCLQGEELPLDVQNVRERILRIERIGQLVKSDDKQGINVCSRWLLAQLKVNLRPLWNPAIQSLERFGEEIWDVLFTDLQLAFQDPDSLAPIRFEDEGEEINAQSVVDDWEDERSWRDPSAHKLRVTTTSWITIKSSDSKGVDDRLDPKSYGLQLLGACAQLSQLVEKHNRDVIALFLSISERKDLPRKTLVAWLSVFAKFVSPKSCYAHERLQVIYYDLLAYPDRSIQTEALNCVLTFKNKDILSKQDQLKALLDTTRWRDELTDLELERESHSVVEVVIRILFGYLTEKRKRGGVGGILSAIARCQDDELVLLVDLMLRPFEIDHAHKREPFVIGDLPSGLKESQQVGYLTLFEPVLKSFGPRLIPSWPALFSAVAGCAAAAQKKIGNQATTQDEEPVDESDDVPDLDAIPTSKLTRTVRQLSLRRFADFFKAQTEFDFAPYLSACFASFVSPRLDMLSAENTQAPSAILEVLFTWSQFQPLYLVQYDERVLPQILNCMTAPSVKPLVVSRIFDMIARLLAASEEEEAIRDCIIKPHISIFLEKFAATVDIYKTDTQMGQKHINIVSQLAPYCEHPQLAEVLVGLFVPLLKRSHKHVPDKVKADLLSIISELVPLVPEYKDPSTPQFQTLYRCLSSLFSGLRSRQSRVNLALAYKTLASSEPSLLTIATLLEDLNSYSTKRIEEPDFDRRLTAFAMLDSRFTNELSPLQWLPLIYEMLNCIQDPEELSIRTSGSGVLRQFLDVVAITDPSSELARTFDHVLFPALKTSLKAKHELVRAELISVISYAVSKVAHNATLQDMTVLLANGDEEANFFNNILHLQTHRRTRALRRLAELSDVHTFKNVTLTQILLPIVTIYITNPSNVDHLVINEAIATTGRLSCHLSWGSYAAMLRRHMRSAKLKDENERINVRTMVSILENFKFSLDDAANAHAGDANEEENAEEEVDSQATLRSDGQKRIQDAVNNVLLPELIQFLDSRDSTTEDSTRIPVAIGIAKVAKHLPPSIGISQYTRLLTVLCQVFRSKSQDVRDLTRDTINRIAVVLGPVSVPIIVQELRGALTRGPHLHVLAYVTHAMLLHVTSPENIQTFENLDDAVVGIAHVSAEVVFGESGKDVQAEGFKTKMREVRSSTSSGLDSFSILAKHITPGKVSSVLLPVKRVLQETSTAKPLQQADEVLKRISTGLHSNKRLDATDLLTLCHTMITQNSKFLTEVSAKRKNAPKNDRIVQLKRKVEADSDHYSTNSYRFVAFGLDLLHTALKRNRFDFKDTTVMSRLETMVIAVGNTLYSTNSTVLALGLKCVAQLVKCPLKSLERSLPIFIRQALDIIKGTGNTESELAQSALRSLATILRDGPKVQVKEKELVYLLELISPDLEDPERQGTVFTMLRAIVTRKFVVPEIYDLMERMSEVMVTSQSPQVQELCRGVLLQFLLDYPQGKGRLKTQMTFFAKNLSYVHESGRKSVMELLGAVLSKFQERLVWEYADMLFVSLVMVLANDDSAKCKEMAAQLVKGLLSRLDLERKETIMKHLHAWASQEARPKLMRVAAQVYGLIIDAFGVDAEPYVDGILADVNAILLRSSEALATEETAEQDEDGDIRDVSASLEWQSPYYGMLVISKAIQAFPGRSERVSWTSVVEQLLFRHSWVRNAACRLMGVLFSTLTLETVGEVETITGNTLREVAGKLSNQLKSQHLEETLGTQIVKNLFFLGKAFYARADHQPAVDSDESEAEEEAEAEDANENENESGKTENKGDLPWLFSKLSYQTRSAQIARRNRRSHSEHWAQQPLNILRWFAAMTTYMQADDVVHYLVHILTPVYRILDDDSIRDPQMDELKTLATELQDLLQQKVGAGPFSQVYNRIRQGAIANRNERRVKRVQGMQHPEKAEAMAQRKVKKNIAKKESKKRKSAGFADGRGRVKKMREEV